MKAKRLLSALLAIAVVCSSMIFSSTTFAESQEPEIFATIGFEAPDYAKDAQIHTIQGWTLSTSFPGYLTTGAYVRDAAALEGKGLSPLSGEQSLLFEKILDAAILSFAGYEEQFSSNLCVSFDLQTPAGAAGKFQIGLRLKTNVVTPFFFNFQPNASGGYAISAFDGATTATDCAVSPGDLLHFDLSFHIDARTVDTTVSNVTTGQSWIKQYNLAALDTDAAVAELTGPEGGLEFVDLTESGSKFLLDNVVISDKDGQPEPEQPEIQLYKDRSILFPKSFADGAKENASKEWAAPIVDQIMEDVAHYEDMSYDDMWDLMFPSTIQKRELMVSAYGNCPVCGEPNQIYAWVLDPKADPWKVRCPHCDELFPKNDFYAFYQSGIDPDTGVYDPALADRSLLYNEECKAAGPDENGNCAHGNPYDACTFCVDDGTSYVGELNGAPYHWYFIGGYLYRGHWFEYVLDAVNNLSSAYMVTGDVEYARKAAIVIDRIADLFPDFDYRNQGWVYEKPTSDGYVTYSIDSAYDVRILAESYDMIFDAIKDDQILVDFLQGKAEEYPEGIAPKDSFEDIQRNIEENIFLDALAHPEKIYTNYPNTDITVATVKAVLNLPGAAEDVVSVLGGIVSQSTQVDGLSGEKGLTNYSAYAVQNLAPTISKFLTLDENLLTTLLEQYPSLYDTYRFYADLWYDGERYPHQGDGGWFAQKDNYGAVAATDQGTSSVYVSALSPSVYTYLWNFYEATGDTMFVKILYNMNDKSVDGLPHDIMCPDPEAIQQEIAAIIAEEGADLSRGNANKENWGIAMMRSNEENSGPAFWLNYQSGLSHGHGDGMNLGLFAKGHDLMPDLGYPPVNYEGAWESPQAMWNRMDFSHNQVIVDKDDHGTIAGSVGQQTALGTTELWSPGSGFSAIRVSNPTLYAATANGRYERTVAMLGIGEEDAYLLDISRVSGGSEHARMMSSMPGLMTTTSLELVETSEFAELPALAPIVSNEKFDAEAQPGFTVDWAIDDILGYDEAERDVHLKYTDLTTGAMAYTFDAWTKIDTYDNDKHTTTSRLATVRRAEEGEALESTFVGVIEPYEGASNIASVTRLDVKDADGNVLPDSHVAVEVVLQNGDRDLIIAADPDLYSGEALTVDGWDVELTGELASVRLTKDGQIKALSLSNGESLIVNGKTYAMPEDEAFYEAAFDVAYDIVIADTEHGTVSADKEKAYPGETVTLTVKADDGYRLKEGSLKVNGEAIEGSAFVMPGKQAEISAEFKLVPPPSSGEPEVSSGETSSGSSGTEGPSTGSESAVPFLALLLTGALSLLCLLARRKKNSF